MDQSVSGGGPVFFNDAKGGEYSIPLTALTFNGATVKADHWAGLGALSATEKQALSDWLAQLASDGTLTPVPTTTLPALVLTAVATGSSGNDIQVTFANVTPDPVTPANTTANITVAQNDSYTGLTPDTIAGLLGTDTTTGTRPGLVQVKGVGPYGLPKAGVYTFAGGGAGVHSHADITANTGATPAFTLQVRFDTAEGDLLKVTISAVDAVNHTFALAANWTKALANVKLTDINTDFGTVISAAPPAGGAFAAPANGSLTLVGGNDNVAAAAAKATAFTG